jgi:hypothetical protein
MSDLGDILVSGDRIALAQCVEDGGPVVKEALQIVMQHSCDQSGCSPELRALHTGAQADIRYVLGGAGSAAPEASRRRRRLVLYYYLSLVAAALAALLALHLRGA